MNNDKSPKANCLSPAHGFMGVGESDLSLFIALKGIPPKKPQGQGMPFTRAALRALQTEFA